MIKKLIALSLLAVASRTGFSQSFNKQRLDSLFKLMDEKEKFMGSIAISQNGKLLYTNTIGYTDLEAGKKANSNTAYRIGSITKTFTATMVFKAIEENKLSLTQTLDKFYPEIENAGKITIGNLLNHRSGIHNFTNDEAYLTYLNKAKSEAEMVKIITQGKSDFEPGTQTSYSNSNYVLLTFILQKINQQSYGELLNNIIVKPLGLTRTHFGGKINPANNEAYSYSHTNKWEKESETDLSIPLGAGAIVSTPTDLNTFITQLFAGKIISEKSVAQMKTVTDNMGMGMMMLPYYDKKSYGHNGGIDGFQSVLGYFPEEKLAVALTSNGIVYPNNNILLCALSCFFNKPFDMPTFTQLELPASVLEQYAGNYTSTQLPLKITITKEGNTLMAQATGQSAFPLDAVTPTTFKFDQAGIRLEFNAEKKQFVLKQGGKEFLYTKE